MLTRPPRERPVLPGRHTWLYTLDSPDALIRAYPASMNSSDLAPTADGHQPCWAVMHNPATTAYAYLWLCLTEVDCPIYGTGECGSWRMTEDRPTAEAQAARHAAAHDQDALAAHLDASTRPPSTVMIPTQQQVETAVRRSQAQGPCTVTAVRDALLRMRAAHGHAVYTGRAAARTLVLLPDGTILHDRAAQKIRRQEQGHRYCEEKLIRFGAAAPRAGADPAEWLREALANIGARRIRHRGAHRYIFCLGVNRREREAIRLGDPPLTTYPKLPDPPD